VAFEENPPASSSSSDESDLRDKRTLRGSFSYCFKVFLSVRVGLFVVGLLGVALLPSNAAPSVPGWVSSPLTPGWHNIFTSFERWDALWFLRLATKGYAVGDGSAAFFPLYPLFVRGLSAIIGGHPLAAALLISNGSFLGGLMVVHALTEEEWDRDMARRTVLYMAIFPTAFFFVAPYSESLFLLLSAGSLLAARRGKWAVAAVLGALAAATRSMGILLILPLALQAIAEWRGLAPEERSPWTMIRSLGAALFVGAGTFCYLLFWQLKNGDFWAPLSSQGGWQRHLSWFWSSLIIGTKQAFSFIGTYAGGYHQFDWIIVAISLGALIWVIAKARLPYVAYSVAALLMPLSLIFEGRAFMSVPRFVLPIFPLFWALAHLSRRFNANDLVVAVSAAGLGLMTVLFVNWYYIF
jgi:hypothetical protein